MEEKKKKKHHKQVEQEGSKKTEFVPDEMKLLAAPKEVVESEPKRKRLPAINSPMETRHFVFSQVFILILSLLFLAGMYWFLNNDNFTQTFADKYSPVTSMKASFELELKQPNDELLTFSKELVISGSTAAKGSVIIAIDGQSAQFDSIEANTMGDFEKTVSLMPGLNRIEITAFDGQNQKTEVRTVYYSEEEIQ